MRKTYEVHWIDRTSNEHPYRYEVYQTKKEALAAAAAIARFCGHVRVLMEVWAADEGGES